MTDKDKGSFRASPSIPSELVQGGVPQWRPIETAMTEAPHWCAEVQGRNVRYIKEVLVYGRAWEGGWNESPYDKDPADLFSGPPAVFMATYYQGAPCWIVSSSAPSDYDVYVRPTHWMPLPAPPADAAPATPNLAGYEGRKAEVNQTEQP